MPRPGEALIEVGPGRGALTFDLARAAGALTAVEIDRVLVQRLRTEAEGAGVSGLEVIEADALSVDFAQLAAGRKLRLIGNLPYNLSSPLLFHFLAAGPVYQDLHLMLQREVVERITAAPGSKVYGRLSVMVQHACTATRLLKVPAGAFTPQPKVESAFFRLVPRPDWPQAPTVETRLAAVVKAAFAQRRKTLRNALAGVLDAEQLSAAGIDPQNRAEQLSVEDFRRLASIARPMDPSPMAGACG